VMWKGKGRKGRRLLGVEILVQSGRLVDL
jgi:hypothetical protein